MNSILVVEDDFSMRRGMALMLEGQGYEVFEASDEKQALQMLGEQSVVLAIIKKGSGNFASPLTCRRMAP